MHTVGQKTQARRLGSVLGLRWEFGLGWEHHAGRKLGFGGGWRECVVRGIFYYFRWRFRQVKVSSFGLKKARGGVEVQNFLGNPLLMPGKPYLFSVSLDLSKKSISAGVCKIQKLTLMLPHVYAYAFLFF